MDIKELFYEKDTYEHKLWVSQKLMFAAQLILQRASRHDDSKFSNKERPFYEAPVYKLNLENSVEYGSEEYKALVKQMGEGWDHHKANNDHHPEFFDNDLSKMNLIQLLEMVCDWFAAARRKGNLPQEALKFMKAELSPQLKQILLNTIDELKEPEAKEAKRGE